MSWFVTPRSYVDFWTTVVGLAQVLWAGQDSGFAGSGSGSHRPLPLPVERPPPPRPPPPRGGGSFGSRTPGTGVSYCVVDR